MGGSTHPRQKDCCPSAPLSSASPSGTAFNEAAASAPDIETLQRTVRRAAGRFVSERTRRRPMIVPVVMEA